MKAFQDEGLHAQQLSDYDPSHNCHSYTFTDGKTGPINDSTVIEQIIQDNFQSITSRDHNGRYTYTQKPQEEDIIVYWNDNRDAIHSGVISKFDNDPKKMLVKSKMSEYGLFKHSAILPEVLKTAFAQAFHDLLPERAKIALLPEELKITHWEIYRPNRPQGRVIKEVSSSDEE